MGLLSGGRSLEKFCWLCVCRYAVFTYNQHMITKFSFQVSSYTQQKFRLGRGIGGQTSDREGACPNPNVPLKPPYCALCLKDIWTSFQSHKIIFVHFPLQLKRLMWSILVQRYSIYASPVSPPQDIGREKHLRHNLLVSMGCETLPKSINQSICLSVPFMLAVTRSHVRGLFCLQRVLG